MRQFILAKQFVEAFDEQSAVGDLMLSYPLSKENDVNAAKTYANLVLLTENGPINFPIHPKNITGSVMPYDDGTPFMARFEIGEVNPYLDYTVTFVKKGKQFNERNKWTTVIHSKKTDTPETIAKAIVDFVNNNPSLGLNAGNAEAVVTVSGGTEEDYTIVFGDELYGTQFTHIQEAESVRGDVAYIRDLFEKCAADRGFTYTGEDLELYPGYKVNIEEGEYDVMTLRFTEPRAMGTREEEVYQIIQIVMPNDDNQMGSFCTAINDFVGQDIFNIEEQGGNQIPT